MIKNFMILILILLIGITACSNKIYLAKCYKPEKVLIEEQVKTDDNEILQSLNLLVGEKKDLLAVIDCYEKQIK